MSGNFEIYIIKAHEQKSKLERKWERVDGRRGLVSTFDKQIKP